MKKSIVALIAISGILAFVLAVLGTIALGALMPGYDPIRSTISEIGERGSPLFIPVAILINAIGAAEIVFAVGLARRSGMRKAALAGSAFLIANGLFDYIGSGVFTIDPGGSFETFSVQAHFIVSIAGMSVMVLPAFFYWRVFKAEGRAAPARITLAAAIVIVVAAVAFNAAFFTERLVGLAQRCLDFAYFAWILAVAVAALKGKDRASA